MKRKNKLPRYWLGTRMPTSLGYQPNYGIGNVLYNSTPGLSIEPDVRALKNNTIPNTISKGMQYGSFITEALKNTTPILSKSAFRSALFNNPQNAAMLTSGSPVASAKAVANAANTGTKIGLNTAGKAIAGIGAAYGLADMGFQIANNLDHRSAGQMRNTLSTNTYTTDLGNTYTTLGGVDRNAELNYARAQRLNKNLNFTTTAIGTGATIGSFWPGPGTAVGAGVGALVGLGANLLGFGDTEEETNKEMDLLTDAVSMGNRMSESLGLDKDAKQGFYGRTKSGSIAGAALGKESYGKMNGQAHGEKIELRQGPNGYTVGKATSMGMPGELMYDTTTKLGDVIRGSGNGDTVPLSVKLNDPTAIYSKILGINGTSFAEIAEPYIQHQNELHKIIENAGGSERQKQFQIDMAKRAMDKNHQTLMNISKAQDMVRQEQEVNKYRCGKSYKCGKIPRYSLAKNPYLEYGAIAVPNVLLTLAAWQQYNTDKNMPVEARRTVPDYGAARNDIYRAINNQPETRPIINQIDNDIYSNLYGVSQKPGLGMGGRAVLADSVIRSGMKLKANTMYQAELDRIQNTNKQLENLANIDTRAENMRVQADIDYGKAYALASAAKHNSLAQDLKNIVLPFGQMAKDTLAKYQFDVASAIKDRMVNIFDKTSSTEESEILNALFKKYGPDWIKYLQPKQSQIPLFHQKALAAQNAEKEAKQNIWRWT